MKQSATQLPELHTSPEPHEVPSGSGASTQVPFPSQLPVAAAQALPVPGHLVPEVASTIVQPPLPLQVELAWQLVGVHEYAVPAQVPFVQTSLSVHAFWSLQTVLLGASGFEHVPPVQVPATWHWSCAVHTIGFEPVQVPAWQV